MKKSVRGFCNDEVSRKLMQRHKLIGDVIKMDEVDIEVDVTFDSASIEFEEQTHRPYIAFRDGHITAVTGDFPFDVTKCSFTRKNAPDLELQWDLSNEEIKQLIDKGLYGFDDSYPRVRKGFEIPDIFTEVLWAGIPMKGCIYAMEAKLEDETRIPIISIVIEKQYEQLTNSRKSAYDNIATYFARPEFYDESHEDNKNAYFSLSDEDVLGLVQTDTAKAASENQVVETLQVLSPSQQQEEAIRGKLRQQVRENIEAAASQVQVEDMARMDENLDIDYLEIDKEADTIGEYEPYTADELEALHIVARKDEDFKTAEAKLTAQAMKAQEKA